MCLPKEPRSVAGNAAGTARYSHLVRKIQELTCAVQVALHVQPIRQSEKRATKSFMVTGTERTQYLRPLDSLRVRTLDHFELPLDPADLLLQSSRVYGQFFVEHRAHRTTNQKTGGDPLVRVGFPTFEIFENHPARKGLISVGISEPWNAASFETLMVQAPVEDHRSGFAREKHQLFHNFFLEFHPPCNGVNGEEPRPGPVASHGHPAPTFGAAGDSSVPSPSEVRGIDEAGDALVPRGVARLKRKTPSWNVTCEIKQTMDMDQPGAVLVEPQHGSAIRGRALDRCSEVVQKARPPPVSARESPRVF